jgi:chaperonin GroEL (HSP60 family)
MLLCGSLLIEANILLKKGLHPLKLVEGYRLALDAAKEKIAEETTTVNKVRLLGVAKTALRGKGAETAIDLFSNIIVEALSLLSENRDSVSSENVTMFKTGLNSIHDSRFLKGVIINRRVLMDNLPNNLLNPNIAVLNSDLKLRSFTRNVEIKITDTNQLDSFIEAEQESKELIANTIINTGADVVFCTGEIDREILHLLSDNSILTVGELDSTEIENIAESTGANVVDSILDIESSDIGTCGKLDWERRENTDKIEDIITIGECKKPKIVTIEVGGSGDVHTEEIIRGLHDSLRATSNAISENEIILGAGTIHSQMANSVRVASESEPGKARLAMEAFARALETIPATLVENSGGDSLDRILELRAAARESDIPMGINKDGFVTPTKDIWHPRSVIENSLESATETAMSMLRIDQVISSRGD